MRRIALPALAFSLLSTGAVFAQDEVTTPPEPAPVAAPALASASLTITLDSTSGIERTLNNYQCDNGDSLGVQYINAAPNFLAIVPVDGEAHIFATTISASGARYISGPFEWWSHQGEATLRDLTQDEDADPIATCTEVTNTP